MKFNILALSLILLLSGCSLINEYDGDCPGVNDDELIHMSFRMIAGDVRNTRTDNAGHDETDSEWQAFENLVNAEDFAFFIFANVTGDNWQLVMKVTDLAGSTDPNMMITGSTGAYTVTAVIPKQKLEAKLQHELSPDSSDPVNFKLVILANAGDSSDYDTLDTSDFDTFMTDASELTFNVSSLYKNNPSGQNVTDIISGAIPMFALKSFAATEGDLFASRPEDRIWAGDINMLRALAKVRVEDNIENRDDATGLPRIENVTFRGATPYAYTLPANASTYIDGNQVETPRTVPFTGGTGSPSLQYTFGQLSNDNPGIRLGYVPEQLIQYGSPALDITVTYELNADGSPAKQDTFTVPMTGYNGELFTFGDAILRNHIYTLSVDHVDLGAEAEITVNVEDWTQSSYILDYTETVTVGQKIQWVPDSYFSTELQGTDQYMVLKPWGTQPDGSMNWVPLAGTFQLQTPRGANWTASLISIEGEPTIAFLCEDGSTSNTVSGTINGTASAELKIVSTMMNPSQTNSAQLQVVVTLPNGTVLEVPLTPDGINRFIIVQNPQ